MWMLSVISHVYSTVLFIYMVNMIEKASEMIPSNDKHLQSSFPGFLWLFSAWVPHKLSA